MRTCRWFGVLVFLFLDPVPAALRAAPQGGALTLEGGQAGADFGRTLASGDFNGDGFGDLVVGAPRFDRNGRADAGRVTVYHGSAAGLSSTPGRTLHGERAGDLFGSALGVGDVNGDGHDDLFSGAPRHDRLPERHLSRASLGHGALDSDEGRTYVFLGSPAGLAGIPQRTITAIEAGAHGGAVLASPGDVNGDGIDELLLGAPGLLDGTGAVYLFKGSANGIVGGHVWFRYGGELGAGEGLGLGPAGDANSDGFADFLVVEPEVGSCGTAYLFAGSPLGPGADPIHTHQAILPGPAGNLDQTGASEYFFVARTGYLACNIGLGLFMQEGHPSTPEFLVESAGLLPAVAVGDVNGDGWVDLIHSDPSSEAGPFLGSVTVRLNRSPAHDFPVTTTFPYHGDQAGAGWGSALAAADVDGDGANEIFVGAPRQDAGEEDEGVVVLIPGWHAELELVQTNTIPSELPLVSADFDADGYADLLSRVQNGGLRVRRGSAGGLLATHQPLSFGVSLNGEVGPSTGDVNGDGFTDLLVTHSSPAEVKHSLFMGSAVGLGTVPAVTIFPSGNGGEAELVGDVNGDGYDDLLVILPDLGDQLLLGSEAGLVTTPFQTLAPAETQPSGDTVSAPGVHRAVLPGDFDGDPFGDLIVARWNQASLIFSYLDLYQGSSSGLTLYDSWDASEFTDLLHPYVELRAWQDFDFDASADLLIELFQYRIATFQVTPGGPVRSYQWWDKDDGSSVVVEDLDGDAFADLYFGDQLHRGSPSGFSREPAWFGSVGGPPHHRGDFDGDGLPSIVSRNFIPGGFTLDIHEVVSF